MSIKLASHYIFTSPCFYHSSENITSNISRNPRFILIFTNTSIPDESSGPTASLAGLAFRYDMQLCNGMVQYSDLLDLCYYTMVHSKTLA